MLIYPKPRFDWNKIVYRLTIAAVWVGMAIMIWLATHG